ncbi:YveK family protein [Paenibacillus glycinis]|uniref:Polysaccharide chain length determinant N-terminal domain-containing protein n=1 Tax=Paenibacillus glycinis TaxID=2697035 RepID=A0ABW9XNJ9_9BACL|nr:Wzz/FepE/Etk N-terminal domain-containing protein [Paenibacillus glycinis]NBD24211.1 hypothetical protein [Paenibacillus glycinis]
MDIDYLIKAISRHIIAVIIILVVCVGGGFLINTFSAPQYRATATLVANMGTVGATSDNKYNDYLASQLLTKTYEDTIQSHQIAEEAKKMLSTSLTASQLLQKIQVRTDPGTLVVLLYVTDDNPKDAVAIANAFATSFVNKSKEIVHNSNVTVLDLANFEETAVPVSPKKKFNLAISLFIGLFLSLSVSLYLEKKRERKKEKSRLSA